MKKSIILTAIFFCGLTLSYSQSDVEKKVDYLERIYFSGETKEGLNTKILIALQELENKQPTQALAKQVTFLLGIKDKAIEAKNACDILDLLAVGIYNIDAAEAVRQGVKMPSEKANGQAADALASLNKLNNSASNLTSLGYLLGGKSGSLISGAGKIAGVASTVSTIGKSLGISLKKKDKPCDEVVKKDVEIGAHPMPDTGKNTNPKVITDTAISKSQPTSSTNILAPGLAKQVLAGGNNVESALRNAILTAGIGIRENNNTITQSVKPGQNLVFNHWEVAAMVKMSSMGMTLKFTDLAVMLSKVIPGLDSVSAGKLLLNDIQTQANSNNPSFNFWANFIIELSRQSRDSIDLMKNVDLTKVSLNAIQTTLILQRLGSDLIILYRSSNKKLSNNQTSTNGLRRSQPQITNGGFQVFLASYNNPLNTSTEKQELTLPSYQSQSHELASNKADLPGCEGTDELPIINPDIISLGVTTVFDYFLNKVKSKLEKSVEDYLEKHGVLNDSKEAKLLKLEKFEKVITAANTILAYSKFIMTYASLDIEISMENEPLVRRKDRFPGEMRRLTAKVNMNTANLQFLNCVRFALNAVGLDVDITRNGAVKGANVRWLHIDGYMVTIKNPGSSIQDAGIGIQHLSKPVASETNNEGKVQIEVWGAARPIILPDNATPVTKEFKVAVTLQLEPPEIKSTVADAASLANPTGLVNLIPELFYKTHWSSSNTYTFKVKDWAVKKRNYMLGELQDFFEGSIISVGNEKNTCVYHAPFRKEYEECVKEVKNFNDANKKNLGKKLQAHDIEFEGTPCDFEHPFSIYWNIQQPRWIEGFIFVGDGRLDCTPNGPQAGTISMELSEPNFPQGKMLGYGTYEVNYDAEIPKIVLHMTKLCAVSHFDEYTGEDCINFDCSIDLVEIGECDVDNITPERNRAELHNEMPVEKPRNDIPVPVEPPQ